MRLMRWSAACFLLLQRIVNGGFSGGSSLCRFIPLASTWARRPFTLWRWEQPARQLLTYTARLQTSLIGLEGCAGAHFLGRALRKRGHDVKLIPGQFVKSFVKSNKNDFVDAEAIAEAVVRKNMHFVPIKTDDQLNLQAIHRVRDRLVSRRTAVINQIRAFLLERGLVFAKRPAQLRAAMADVLENAEADLTPMMRNLINTLWSECKTVEGQIEELGEQLERISAADAGCTRIRQIPGVGPVVATAIVSTACSRQWSGRATYKDRHARISSWPGELVSTQTPNMFAQTGLLDQTSPCSRTAHPALVRLIRSIGT